MDFFIELNKRLKRIVEKEAINLTSNDKEKLFTNRGKLLEKKK